MDRSVRMTLTANEVHELKKAPAVDGVLPTILERWSPRAYTDRQLGSEELKKVFEAARWAPSSGNEQPWRFLVGAKGSDTYEKIASALVPFNQQWARNAPVLILGIARTRFSQNGNPNGYAAHDLGAATAYLVLEATALGLQAHQMAGFDQAKAREAFGIPEDYLLGSVTALGYQGDPDTLANEKHRAGELAPRTRKPLTEIVLSELNQPANLG